MSKVRQKLTKESEKIENKRWNRIFINSKRGIYKTYLNALIENLNSKKIIVELCLVTVTFMTIPVILILLGFLATFWLCLKGENYK